MKTFLTKKVVFPLFLWKDGLRGFSRNLRALRASQYWTDDRMNDYQLQSLKNLISHAYNKSIFYKQRWDSMGLKQEDIRSFSDFARLPVLTKNDIKEHLSDILTRPATGADLYHAISGGTTGISIDVYNDSDSLTRKHAALTRFEEWGGWRMGEWQSLVWPAAVDMAKTTLKGKLRNILCEKAISLQMAVIEDEDIRVHLKELSVKRPTTIRGFPSQLTEVARYIHREGVLVPPLRGVITTGEPLWPGDRQVIESAFKCSVFDSYRTREVGPIAQECENHDGLHVSAETVYLEIMPLPQVDLTTSDGIDQGSIIVTDLTNYAMPLIRYQIGDIGSLRRSSCSCGRGLPLLDNIGGRLTDVLYTCEGKKIAPVSIIPKLFHLLGIMNQFKVVQEAFDQLRVVIKLPKPPVDLLDRQRKVIEDIFGKKIQVTYDFVDEIPPLPSGKYPFIESRIR
ncbi:MAG: Phenylacetate-coenzyme A ligase [Syntrophorhabdus sp. PtaB.Bin006]|nr:MAG: Phenylacetate-coenzyme A ligase [Syntrophorhabdus sp. PtaB.Bin006]